MNKIRNKAKTKRLRVRIFHQLPSSCSECRPFFLTKLTLSAFRRKAETNLGIPPFQALKFSPLFLPLKIERRFRLLAHKATLEDATIRETRKREFERLGRSRTKQAEARRAAKPWSHRPVFLKVSTPVSLEDKWGSEEADFGRSILKAAWPFLLPY